MSDLTQQLHPHTSRCVWWAKEKEKEKSKILADKAFRIFTLTIHFLGSCMKGRRGKKGWLESDLDCLVSMFAQSLHDKTRGWHNQIPFKKPCSDIPQGSLCSGAWEGGWFRCLPPSPVLTQPCKSGDGNVLFSLPLMPLSTFRQNLPNKRASTLSRPLLAERPLKKMK